MRTLCNCFITDSMMLLLTGLIATLNAESNVKVELGISPRLHRPNSLASGRANETDCFKPCDAAFVSFGDIQLIIKSSCLQIAAQYTFTELKVKQTCRVYYKPRVCLSLYMKSAAREAVKGTKLHSGLYSLISISSKGAETVLTFFTTEFCADAYLSCGGAHESV